MDHRDRNLVPDAAGEVRRGITVDHRRRGSWLEANRGADSHDALATLALDICLPGSSRLRADDIIGRNEWRVRSVGGSVVGGFTGGVVDGDVREEEAPKVDGDQEDQEHHGQDENELDHCLGSRSLSSISGPQSS